MKQEGTPLSSAEQQAFKQLTDPLDQAFKQRAEQTDQAAELLTDELEKELSAQRAADSWQGTPRPNPLAEFDTTNKPPRDDGRKYIPLGHVAFKGDFGQPS